MCFLKHENLELQLVVATAVLCTATHGPNGCTQPWCMHAAAHGPNGCTQPWCMPAAALLDKVPRSLIARYTCCVHTLYPPHKDSDGHSQHRRGDGLGSSPHACRSWHSQRHSLPLERSNWLYGVPQIVDLDGTPLVLVLQYLQGQSTGSTTTSRKKDSSKSTLLQ